MEEPAVWRSGRSSGSDSESLSSRYPPLLSKKPCKIASLWHKGPWNSGAALVGKDRNFTGEPAVGGLPLRDGAGDDLCKMWRKRFDAVPWSAAGAR